MFFGGLYNLLRFQGSQRLCPCAKSCAKSCAIRCRVAKILVRIGFSVSQPWDQQPNERDSSYRKFQQYLELGPRRTATELAQRLGLSQQAVSKLALSNNWNSRAKAYDIAHGHVEPSKAPPPPPPPPRPPRKPPAPPPVDASQPIEPEVVGAILASDQAEEQISGFAEYRRAFEPVGRKQLVQAMDAADGVDVAHRVIMTILPLWLKALEQTGSQDPDIASMALARCDFYSKQSQAAARLYTGYAEAEVKLAGGDARTIWGDVTGVLVLLQEAFPGKAIK